jgi:hypothetical protein
VIFIPQAVVNLSHGRFKRTLFRMAEQLRGPFEKFVDSPFSKKRLSPHLYKVSTRSNKGKSEVVPVLN